jgi:hypothetical protein
MRPFADALQPGAYMPTKDVGTYAPATTIVFSSLRLLAMRRTKSYAAETGVVYRYFFESCRSTVRPAGLGPGSDFIFVLRADQGRPFALRVFVSEKAVAAWSAVHGRRLDASEQYAAAKMMLFRAFDQLDNLPAESLSLVVDETNVEELLESLDL